MACLPQVSYLPEVVQSPLLFLFPLFIGREPYMLAKFAHHISRQLKETSGIGAYTAQPATPEAAKSWQAICV